MRKALVTGGAGFLGSHLCDRLLSEGYDVIVLDNLITGRLENIAHLSDRDDFTFVDIDVSRGIDVNGPLDFVFHAASPASPPVYLAHQLDTLRANSQGTLHALETARITGARFVLFSTSEIYGDSDVIPQAEHLWGHVNPVSPRSVYTEGKRFAEALTMAYHREKGVNTAIVRIFNTYGPRMRVDDGRVIPNLITRALRNEPLEIYGDGTQSRSFCYVSDLIEGLWRMANSDEIGPINLGRPLETTIREMAGLILPMTGSSSEIVCKAQPVPDDPRRRCPDIQLAREKLGWEPHMDLGEGLQRTVQDFQRRLLDDVTEDLS